MRYGIPEPERADADARSALPPPILGLALGDEQDQREQRPQPERPSPERGTSRRRRPGSTFFFAAGSE